MFLHFKRQESTPDDNVKNCARCPKHSECRKDIIVLYMFPILNLRMMMFVYVPVKFPGQVKTDDVTMKKSLILFFYRFKLFFIDRYVYFN